MNLDDLRTELRNRLDAVRYGPLGSAVVGARQAWRPITLLSTLAALVLVYVTFFSGIFETREMVITHRWQPNLGTVVFGLGDTYAVRSIAVRELEGEDLGDVVWRVERTDSGAQLDAFAYRQQLRGMAVPDDTPVRGLEPGGRYHLTVVASGARGEQTFEVPAVN